MLYMSENRSLSVLKVLVHLTDTLPDKFVLGAAEIPDEISYQIVRDAELPVNWQTLSVAEQQATRKIGMDSERRFGGVARSISCYR